MTLSRLRGLIALCLLTGCGEVTGTLLTSRSAAPSGHLRWQCPAEWVEHRAGGCGPAVLLCAPGGEAAAGSCDRLVLDRPREITVDNQVVRSFFRLADGRIGGGWSLRALNPQCPAGWRHAGDGACEPVLPESCPEGSAPAPGGCLAVDTSHCPSQRWADVGAEVRGARVAYVRAKAGSCAEPDGTEACPFTRVADAVRTAGDNGWVLVGAGEYAEALDVASPVHIIGLCSARVTLRAPSASDRVIMAHGVNASLDLRGVTLAGGSAGVHVSRRARATLERVRVVDVAGQGLHADDGELSGREVLIRGTHRAGEGASASGVLAENGASVTLERVAVFDSHHFGVNAQSRARIRVTDILVRGVADLGVSGEPHPEPCPPSDTPLTRYARNVGFGFHAVQGGVVQASRAIIEETQNIGACAGNSLSEIVISDGVIRRLRPRVPTTGKAAYALSGGAITLTRVLVEDVPVAGVSAFCPTSRITLFDSVVRNVTTRPPPMMTAGRGLDAQHGGSVFAKGTAVLDTHNFGIYAYDNATVDFTDGLIQGTRESADIYSAGAGANFNSTVRLRHALLVDNVNAGVITNASGAAVTLRDVIITDGHVGARGTALGIASAGGASLDAEQVAILDAFGGAVITNHLAGDASLRGRHLFVRGVQNTRQPGARDATGVIVAAGATIQIENILVDRSDHGFVLPNVPYGRLSIRRGVFSRQRRLGAVLGADLGVFDTVSLDEVFVADVPDPYVRNTLD